MTPHDLIHHLAEFAAALRRHGVGVGLTDEADALAALGLVDVGDREEVRLTLRAALKIRPRDAAAFEALFAEHWRARSRAEGKPNRAPGPVGMPVPRSAAGRAASEAAVPEGDQPSWSREAVLRRKPFEELAPGEVREMAALLDRLALRLATRKSRRRVPVRGRGEVDLRRSFRRALPQGGEMLSLARRARPVERTRLVVLCDTSGSMDPYSRFLLAFVLALRGVDRSSEVFAFNTELARLTPTLRRLRPGSVERVLEHLAAAVPDWSGGTRISECLAEFVEYYLDDLVNGQTLVLILSDGLDRGDISPLQGALRALRRRARLVLWLNPLAGDRRYEPTARAMAAALPWIDRLLPAHNLESLERLLPLLSA